MSLSAQIGEVLGSMGMITAAMAAVAVLETAIPLHARRRWNRDHLAPNLVLTLVTFLTNAAFGAALVGILVWFASARIGVLNMLAVPPLWAGAIAVVVLDFSFYVGHVAMHKIPVFWRFHRVHHSDPAVDVTTTIRQHPGESIIRYAFTSVFALALGASPAAFAVYRVSVALNGLLEHANIRLPLQVDRLLSFITTWPNMHKVHHSRTATETDTNYSNLFSIWDRLFFTFTPSERGTSIVYGLDGFDDARTQTTAGLLWLPFRTVPSASETPALTAAASVSCAR